MNSNDIDFPRGKNEMRDYFAARALTGLLANPEVYKYVRDGNFGIVAYKIADSMIDARDGDGE
jgi:hypothetical protein